MKMKAITIAMTGAIKTKADTRRSQSKIFMFALVVELNSGRRWRTTAEPT